MAKIRSLIFGFANNTLALNSAALFMASFLGNILNAAYNFVMARFLGPIDYGDLMAIISILYILTFPSVVLNNIITRFAAVFGSQEELSKLRHLFVNFTLKTSLVGGLVVVGFVIFGNNLANYLNVMHPLSLILTSVLAVFMILITENLGALTGLIKFKSVAFINFFWPLVRLTLSVCLVLVGFGVDGAMIGFVVSTIVTYFTSLYLLRFLLKEKDAEDRIESKEILEYSIPASLSILGLTLFVNTDILMVKAFFDPLSAGIYSAGSLLARVILFFTLPLITIVFPILTKKYEAKQPFEKTFLLFLGLLSFMCLGVLTMYTIRPRLFTFLLFGSKYDAVAEYLPIMSVFIVIYCIAYLFTNFWLSIGKLKFATVSLYAALLQALLIALDHSSLYAVINYSLLSSLVLLVSNGLYYLKVRKNFG